MANALVIIPAYNEQENIVKLVENLLDLRLSTDILIVDDGKDGTATLIKELQNRNPNVFLIKREGKLGRGSAVIAGLKFGLERDYEYLVEMDADFSHEPKELPLLMEKATPDGVVIGSRYVRGSRIENWPLKRRIFSRLANFYAEMVLGIGIHDYTNGYRVYGRKAVEKLNFEKIKATGYIVLSEISYQLFRKGVPFTECRSIFVNRSRGGSNFTMKEIKEAFIAVWKIRKVNT
jgi:dolichol-phosphate mannosyltransferase